MSKFGPIGIDFGTTKTTVAYAEPDRGVARIIDNLPTAVLFADDENLVWSNSIIGLDAIEEPRCWKKFKLHMSADFVPVDTCRDASFSGSNVPSPGRLASLVFRYLRNKILEEVDEIGPVTITVPSESNFRHRQAVVFSAHVAGFTNVQILEEPVAAYLYHYHNYKAFFRSEAKTIRSFVIDFGGGTCDLAIIENEADQIPVVLDSRTVSIGGNDIDDAIVGLWKKDKSFARHLPKSGEYPIQLTRELTKAAHLAKHQCNPHPGHAPGDIVEMIKNPLKTQVSSDPKNTFIQLIGGVTINPPSLSSEDLNKVMSEFLPEIRDAINYLLPNEEDIRSIDKVIFAGGSCYIRQVIQFIKEIFTGLAPETDFLFDEPENAIAMGALEFQRAKGEGRNSIFTRLSMSTYLQVDYDHTRDISPLQIRASGANFIYHQGKSYIQLAAKGLPLKAENPQLNPLFGAKFMTIPVRSQRDEIHWPIYQVRSISKDGKDYEAIDDETEPIDEITFSLNTLGQWQPILAPVRLIYAFDSYGDFYRNARIFISPRSQFDSQHNKYPKLDWRRDHLVKTERQKILNSEGE